MLCLSGFELYFRWVPLTRAWKLLAPGNGLLETVLSILSYPIPGNAYCLTWANSVQEVTLRPPLGEDFILNNFCPNLTLHLR